MSKVIINFAPTGMIPTKDQTDQVPVSPEQIIESVQEAFNIGITMVHLHAREPTTGLPSYSARLYTRIIGGIRDISEDLVVCVSTSGRNFKTFAQRSEVLELSYRFKPDMASLTLSSLNFNQQASVNEPEMIKRLATRMYERNIIPELEVFDVGMINYAKYLLNRGVLREPCYFNLIVGNIACAQADPLHIGTMIHSLPQNALFSIGGVGRYQLPANGLAIALGFGVRTGIEDNYWWDRARTRYATNSGLIMRVHDLMRIHEHELMTPREFRNRMGL